jgi:galactokinase
VSITGTENGLSTRTEQFLHLCEKRWPADQTRPHVVTRAPGRLDCMGGMADYSGALALQATIEQGVFIAAGKRDDQRIRVESLGWDRDGQPSVFEWSLSLFYQSDGQFVTPESLSSRFDACPWARHIAGICLGLLESGDLAHLAGGANFVIQSDIPPFAGLASSAALQVACAKAVASLFEVELTAQQIARACRMADTEVLKNEPGLVDHLACLLGEADALVQIRCQPEDVLGSLRMPKGIVFAGIYSGLRLPIYQDRYADNRAASLIGKFLIEQILRASGAASDFSSSHLASIPPNEYVRQFRNQLPVKLRGRDFLTHFGQPEELDVTIVPDEIYKVRSRTEHHIYENDRTHRFMERLARARRTGELDALIEAGELMYASHWSYGQRCGMGSIETDVLVNCIRERGPARGLYGAKVTGGGCGGTVAVLMADTPAAREAIQESCSAYAAKTGKQPQILTGSSPGAMAFGSRCIS